MLRIAICDDVDSICSEIEEIVIEYSEKKDSIVDVEIFTEGERLIEFIKTKHEFDLIFLDIDLITTTGIKIGTIIRDEFNDLISKIVFISSKTEYALELFKLQPLDFLQKPIIPTDIIRCIKKTLMMESAESRFFEFQSMKQNIKVNINKILYFENILRKVKIVTIDEEFVFYDKISLIIKRLPKNFIISHNSYIVNYNNIKLIFPDKIVMNNNSEIPISKKYRKSIEKYQVERVEEEIDDSL